MEKKKLKVSLLSILLLVSIIVIVVMGYYIYRLSGEKKLDTQEISNLKTKVSQVEEKSNTLQNTIENIKNTVTNTVPSETQKTESTEEDAATKNNISSNLPQNTEDVYNKFLDGILKRTEAEAVEISSNTNGKIGYLILGTDNKLYLETYDYDNDTKIPGASGTGGDYVGKYIGIDNVVRIFEAMHGGHDSGAHGVLILKSNGELYLLRNPGDNDYSQEKIEKEYIVDAYVPISPRGRTYLVDIFGKTHVVE